MKSSTRDQAAGKLHELKGAVKQKAGELSKNPKLTASGMAEKNMGKAQMVMGKIKKTVGA